MVVAKNLGHKDTRMVEQHYGHLAPSFVVDAIRAGAAPLIGLSPGRRRGFQTYEPSQASHNTLLTVPLNRFWQHQQIGRSSGGGGINSSSLRSSFFRSSSWKFIGAFHRSVRTVDHVLGSGTGSD